MTIRIRRWLIGTLAALAALPSAASTFDPRDMRRAMVVSANPSAARPAVGSVVKVRIHVSGARRVSSIPYTLTYDPAILEFLPESSFEGGFLKDGGAPTSFLARAGALRDGRIGVVVGHSRLGAAQGARGKGLLCELAFRVRAPGVSPITFVRAQALSPFSEPLPATFRGSTVRARGAR